METIRSYVETMFAALPKSDEVVKAKQGVLESMEDKYNALKAEGKSEAEAVGTVISEFGNIDEITSELGIEVEDKAAEKTDERFITDEEAEEYIDSNRKGGRVIGLGVVLCILAPAILMFVGGMSEVPVCGYLLEEGFSGVLGVALMLMTVAVAVVLFIVQGIKLEKFEDYEKTPLKVSNRMSAMLKEKNNAYSTGFAFSIAGGVGLVFMGIIAMIVLGSLPVGELVAVPVMLAFIAAGVYLFITAGMRRSSFNVLLETGDYNREKKNSSKTKGGKIVDSINSIMWPAVVAGYLIWSFFSGDWGITWIVFPVAGLISGALDGVAKAIDSKND